MRVLTIVALLLLGACAWVLPRPDDTPAEISGSRPDLDQCSLDVTQSRKTFPEQTDADGVPEPLMIRDQSRSGASRIISNGHLIYFLLTRHDPEPFRNYGPDMSRHMVRPDPPGPLPLSSVWRIDAERNDGPQGEEPLLDRSIVRLVRPDAAGYLRFETGSQTLAASADRASLFMLYKADVPDATRPSTCDGQIRDGDFVYLRQVSPSLWIDAADDGVLSAKPVPPGRGVAPAGSRGDPRCARDEERCHTDEGGGLVCAWAPICTN
ncbi:MAG: hypothetical protein WB440_17365 [Steroidobacteraceae bacterium]|jgi:hypothetical protein